jgi:hypothetical protein
MPGDPCSCRGGCVSASAANEIDDNDEEDTVVGEERHNERTGTRYTSPVLYPAIFTGNPAVLIVPQHLLRDTHIRHHTTILHVD